MGVPSLSNGRGLQPGFTSYGVETPAPLLKEVDEEEQDEGGDEHDDRYRGRSAVVVLLQLRDDEEGHDLGLHRHVARDEDHRPVLPERAGEGERETGEER